MISHCILTSVAVIVGFAIDPIVAQLPCPPFPELAAVVDTPEKCTCFWAIAQSGYIPGNPDTYNLVFDDDSVQNFPLTGQYIGPDGISEYLSWVQGGESGFVKDYILIGQELILDMSAQNNTCVITTAERRRLPFNSFFNKDNTEMCVDVVAGTTSYYTLTGKIEAPVTIHTSNVFLPGELISSTFSMQADTQATAEFVCDTIVNICGYDGKTAKSKRALKESNKTKKNKKSNKSKENKKSKESKKNKKSKYKASNKSKAMHECMEKFNSLLDYDTFEGLPYIDGNTKGCRILHSVFAATNSNHCPHISFEADEDVYGLVKCNESKQTRFTDLFTEEQISLFYYANNLLGLPTGFEAKLEACPTAF